MFKAATLVILVALAACSGMPQVSYGSSPCDTSPGGYQCEIQRYTHA